MIHLARKTRKRPGFGWLWSALLLCFFSGTILGQDEADEVYWSALGGRVYDNWMGLLTKQELQKRKLNITDYLSDHPAYPKQGKKKGLLTWRCKECHGWDYRGVDGAYGRGDHFTGIKGVWGKAGAPVEEIVQIIRDPLHGYDQRMIDDRAARSLAQFISQGLVDMSRWITDSGEVLDADQGMGKRHFNGICAICHGLNGKKINFRTPQDPVYLGSLSKKNPWEVLHKMRNGHPGKEMINVRSLPIQSQLNILKHAQSLPSK